MLSGSAFSYLGKTGFYCRQKPVFSWDSSEMVFRTHIWTVEEIFQEKFSPGHRGKLAVIPRAVD